MGEKPVSERQQPDRLMVKGVIQKFSLLPKGMREKLFVAFALMSIIPLLMLGHVLANYVFPYLGPVADLSIAVAIAIGISLLGFIVAKQMIMPVVKLASEAQAIARGDLERQVDTGEAPGEVETIGQALNQITQKVRENMTQLRVYGEQTKHLNLEINRRILTFSHLLQVSNLITQSAKIEEILTFILEKLTQLEEAPLNCLLEPSGDEKSFLVRAVMGTDAAQTQALFHTKLVAPWLARTLKENRVLVVDAEKASPRDGELLQQIFGMTNAVCQPIVAMGQGMGILVSANKKPDFTFSDDCLELLKVFAKQMNIAVENDFLVKRAEELKLIDELTGLYNAGYMKSRLEEEIRRAMRYHRPCSFILVTLDDFEQFRDLYGGLAAEEMIKQAAELLKAQVTDVDRVGRMGAGEFALILPERNKREAIELAEAIRRRIETQPFTQGPQRVPRGLTACAGVSENPLDGADGQTLLTKAMEAMALAQKKKNSIVAC